MREKNLHQEISIKMLVQGKMMTLNVNNEKQKWPVAGQVKCCKLEKILYLVLSTK